jgi:hypothetical protein
MALTRLERGVHSAIERVIALASPQQAVRRQYERKVFEFGYDAANPGRARQTKASGLFNASSENLQNQRDRIKLMWETRDLVQNYSFIKSILLKEAMYVCGKLQYQANTGDPNIDSALEDYWQNWCNLRYYRTSSASSSSFAVGMQRDSDFDILRTAGD